MLRVQVLSTAGTGIGNRDSSSDDTNPPSEQEAVIRGFWRVGYKSSPYSSYLSSQATAAEVKSALESLGTSLTGQIGVDRNPAGSAGWAWSVTFYDGFTVSPPSLLRVDGHLLYSTDANASITVAMVEDPGASL
ncbi:unnamed protein product [Choristocarpus tenellus]